MRILTAVRQRWNNAFFKLLACCLPGLTSAQIDEVALSPISKLPDGAFFDVTSAFLPEVDGVYFNDLTLQDAQAVHVRTALFKRIMTTRAWSAMFASGQRLRSSTSGQLWQ